MLGHSHQGRGAGWEDRAGVVLPSLQLVTMDTMLINIHFNTHIWKSKTWENAACRSLFQGSDPLGMEETCKPRLEMPWLFPATLCPGERNAPPAATATPQADDHFQQGPSHMGPSGCCVWGDAGLKTHAGCFRYFSSARSANPPAPLAPAFCRYQRSM